MTRLDPHDIERQLRDTPAPPPPPELLQKIQQEIPASEELAAEGEPVHEAGASPTAAPRRPIYRRPGWLIAASLLISASLAYRVTLTTDSFDEPTSRETVEVPRASAASDSAASPTPSRSDSADLTGEQRQQLEALGYLGSPGEVSPTASPEAFADAAHEIRQSPREARSRKVVEKKKAPVARRREPIADPRALSSAAAEERVVSDAAPPTDDYLMGVPAPSAPAAKPTSKRLVVRNGRYVKDEIHVTGEMPHILATSQVGTTARTSGSSNELPYDGMYFQGYGTNPFIDTEDDPLSTFGLDVDTGSYSLARSYLYDDYLPPSEAIRVEEFVNYFDYRDAPPRRGDFALVAEGAPSRFAKGPRHYLVRFNISGRTIAPEKRKPATLVFVVDVSGSMERGNRLELVKESLTLLLRELGAEDEVGLVVYGSEARVLLEPSRDHAAIRRAIERLEPGGSTNAEDGIVTAYRLIDDHRRGVLDSADGDGLEVAQRRKRARRLSRSMPRRSRTYRIILCSDGVANVGRTGPEAILERVREEADGGIALTTVGFGMGNYNDVLMEQLADQGDGHYAYVDKLHEAQRVFVENLTSTLETIASDARVQVEFDPRTVSRYRLLGYENRAIPDEDFRNDSVDAGEIGAGHTITALYEIKLRPAVKPTSELAKLTLRYRSAATGKFRETSTRLARHEVENSWEAASPALRLASTVVEFAEILKRTYWVEGHTATELLPVAQRVSADFAGDVDVAEFVSLVGTVSRLETEALNDG